MSMSWVGVKLVGACEPGNFTQSTAPIAYAQNSSVEVSPVFGPRDEREKSTWPVVSASRQLIPADEPLGGVVPPPHGATSGGQRRPRVRTRDRVLGYVRTRRERCSVDGRNHA